MFRSAVSIRVGPVLVLLAGAAFLPAQEAFLITTGLFAVEPRT